MRIGITVQQDRELDARWVEQALRSAVAELAEPIEGFSSLAARLDRAFAQLLLDAGSALYVVVPHAGYADLLAPDAAEEFRRLVARATEVFELGRRGDRAEQFLHVGRYIVDSVHTLFAVWDGHPAQGAPGIADVVEYAQSVGRPIIHLDPVTRRVHIRHNGRA